MSTEIDREDLLLLIFESYERLFNKGSFNGVTRLEKLIFILGQEPGLENVGSLFSFRPYKFGPYSKAVYEAAEFLQSLNMVNVQTKPYFSYFLAEEEKELQRETSDDAEGPAMSGQERLFTLTDRGRTVAQKLRSEWSNQHPDYLRSIDTIVSRYAPLPLNQIIRYVYKRFPAMAKESVHPEAKRLAR